MFRSNRFPLLAIFGLAVLLPVTAGAAEIQGDYFETRTCDIYTGPCFANAEVGLTGAEAMMVWSIDSGTHNGVDLSGLKVVMGVRANDTLGFGGGVTVNPYPIRTAVVVDERATPEQRQALVDFARSHAGKVAGETVSVAAAPIEFSVDHIDMVAKISVDDKIRVLTRKLTKGDCICTNEVVFYPPLAEVENAAAAFTVEGKFGVRGLGVRWQNPNTRSSFLATFAY